MKAAPSKFDTTGMSIQQHFAKSADGTRVPFFVVGKDLDGANANSSSSMTAVASQDLQLSGSDTESATAPWWACCVARDGKKSTDATSALTNTVSTTNGNGNGTRPCVIWAYGAHGATMRPFYNGFTVGNSWLQRGGIFVMANIRGGGEYGYKWHEAAAPNRLKACEDLEAVA